MPDDFLVTWKSPFTQSEGTEDAPGLIRTRSFVDLDAAVSFFMNLPDQDRAEAKIQSGDGKQIPDAEIASRHERIEKERGGLPKAF